MNTLLRATLGFSMLWACQAEFDKLKYCNEGKILWAQMRFYQKEITNRVKKLNVLVSEFSKCRQYTEKWMEWPTEKKVNRRHIIYRYQQNDICTENYLDLSRQGLGPSGHAFQKKNLTTQIAGIPEFNVADPKTVRPVFHYEYSRDRTPNKYTERRLATPPGLIDTFAYGPDPAPNCIPYACAKLPYIPHDSDPCISKVFNHTVCTGKSNKTDCETTWDNEGTIKEPTYCVWVNDTFPEMKTGTRNQWPKPYGNGYPDPEGKLGKYKEEGKTNANLLNGADYSGSTKRLVATTKMEGVDEARSDGKGEWAWIGATRFCAATNTLMHWISKQTLDIQESEHFIKQEAWCNVLEESIIHESIKTTEKREMGALLQQQCDEWSEVKGAAGCDPEYNCKTTVHLQYIGTADDPYRVNQYPALPSQYGIEQVGTPQDGESNFERTTFGNPTFGNRYAVGDVSQTYGQQNVAKMITSPTQVVAWMALKHLGIDTSDEFGDGFTASKNRFDRLRDDDAQIASNLMRDLTGSFHYGPGSLNGFVGGWHYGDRNWNSADGTFNWTFAQTAANSTASVLWPQYFGKNGSSDVSGVPLEIKDGFYKNDDHSGVMPWNVGVDGHGTIKHEAELRQHIVEALKEDEEVSKYFSGLISDPDSTALTDAINAVKSDWEKYNRLNDTSQGEAIAASKAASYAAFSDFTFNFDEEDLPDFKETGTQFKNNQAAAAWYKIQNQESNSGKAFDAASIQETIREIQESAFRADDVDTVVAGKKTASERTVDGYGGTVGVSKVYNSPNKHARARAV